MNFLAHFFLAQEKETWMVGNFLADYLRKPQMDFLPDSIREGVALHLEIDRLTDMHPMVRRGVQRLHPHHRKYAPVVLDVFYDYFLIRNWNTYTSESLEAFTQRVYQSLFQNQSVMPPELRERLPRMIQGDWLQSYGREEGLSYAFLRLQSRMSRPEQLEGVLENHRRYYREMDEEFNAFFPEMVQDLNAWKQSRIAKQEEDYPSK